MKKRTGFYPRVRVDTAGSGVVSQAGGVLLTETVRASGWTTGVVGGAGAVAQAAGGARPGQGAAGPGGRPRRWAGTAWPISRCCGPSRGCTGGSPRTRRCPARSTRWPRTRPRRWRRSTPPGRRPGPGCGRWPASTPRTPGSTRDPAGRRPGRHPGDRALGQGGRCAPRSSGGMGFHPLCAFVDHGAGRHRGAAGGAAAPGQRRVATPPPTTSRSSGTRCAQLPCHRPAVRAGPEGAGPHRRRRVPPTTSLDYLAAQRLSYSVGFTLPGHTADAARADPRARCGHRPTTPTARSGTARGSPSSPAC